jgi:TPP-dependent pyruvate/acetoin dehydrogenase alpha subunit
MGDRRPQLDRYRELLLIRLAEERIRREYPGDEMKTPVHLGIGGEAIAVGVVSVLPRGTPMFGTYRNHALYLALTGDLDGFFGELYGKATGCGRGKAGSMHLTAPEQGLLATSAVVGTTIPLAVGAALASVYRGRRDTAVAFFGDGALEEGVFWESLNFACNRRLPVLFVCEDNGLAIHAKTEDRQGFRSISAVVDRFDCEVGDNDGSDLDAVVQTTAAVLDGMAARERPGFVRFTYFRRLEHVGPAEDFAAGYRARPSDDDLRQLDPVWRYEERLKQAGVPAAALDVVRRTIEGEIDRSVASARQAPFPDPLELDEHVWS